jgi:hypothetical protein
MVFHRLGGMTTEDVEDLVVRIARSVERWLSRQGFGEEDGVEEDPDDVMGLLQEASIRGRAALGKRAGQRARRVQVHRGKEYRLPPKCAAFRGYSLHAGVVAGARDRKGLEALCRYILRQPPKHAEKSSQRRNYLKRMADGTYELKLKTAWSDGTSSLRLSRLEVMERLASVIPPPRVHQVLYHGLFAGRSKWRKDILPQYREAAREERQRRQHRKLVRKGDAPKNPGVSMGWAYLLKRVFDVDGFACPHCGKAMVLRAVSVRPPATWQLLGVLGRGRGPPAFVD